MIHYSNRYLNFILRFFRLSKYRPSAVPDQTASRSKTDDSDVARRDSTGSDPNDRLRKDRIHGLKEISSTSSGDTNYSSPDVQFILEVKRSNIKACYKLCTYVTKTRI